MPQYDPTPCPAVVTAAWLNAEYAAVKAAFDTHDTGDFPEKCVPITAVANDEWHLFMNSEKHATIAADVDVGFVTVAVKGTVIKGYGICNACVGNPTATLYRRRNGVEAVIMQPITYAAAHTPYLPALTNTDLLPGDTVFTRLVALGKSVKGSFITVVVQSKHTP